MVLSCIFFIFALKYLNKFKTVLIFSDIFVLVLLAALVLVELQLHALIYVILLTTNTKMGKTILLIFYFAHFLLEMQINFCLTLRKSTFIKHCNTSKFTMVKFLLC